MASNRKKSRRRDLADEMGQGKKNHMDKDKIWCIYFGLIPKLAWPMQIYEVSLTKVETMERLISKSI